MASNAKAGDCECDGDVDGDGQITPIDLLRIRQCVFENQPPPGGTLEDCDRNCDGNIDFCDLGIVGCHFNTGDPEFCCGSCGACCIADGMGCALATEESCITPPPNGAGGNFLGVGSECSTVNAAIFFEPGGEVFVHVIGPPVDCNDQGGQPEVGCTGPPFMDPWVSDPDDAMCHNFGVEGSPAIPANFFGPGSEPFTGSVCLMGMPLGIPEFGEADTIILRSDDPFDRCELPSANESTVDIEIIDLSLVSIDPISVTINGEPTQWDVAVDLSEVVPPAGSLTAVKTHCNGGTYTSVLNVQPRFTFTSVEDPNDVQVLDTGVEGIDPVQLVQNEPFPWVSDVDEILGASVDPCSDFHAGLEESEPVADCDCNNTGQRDDCDIEDGTSEDCNENAAPDECDISSGSSMDNNGNGIPDECEDCAAPEFVPGAQGVSISDRLFDGYIDPRNESDNGVDVNQGLDRLTVEFSIAVQNVDGTPISAGAFSLSDTGGSAPNITGISTTDNQTITVQLDGIISVAEWTTLTVSAAAFCDTGQIINDSIDVGFLPADVDQNGMVTPFDLLQYRQYVNDLAVPAFGVLVDYVDTDRNNALTPFDLLAFRQLVNGITPATQSWNGVSLPPQP